MSCKNCIEKQMKIDDLERRIEHLENQLQHQKRKEKEGFFGSSTPPSKIPVKENTNSSQENKNGGAKPGHIGKGRRAIDPGQSDRTITLNTTEHCPDCGGKLEHKGWKTRSSVDLDLQKVKKIVYNCENKWCPKCKKSVQAKPDILPRSLYGNSFIANALVMHFVHGIPAGRLEEIYGAEVTSGIFFKIFHRIAGLWEKSCENLIEEFRKQPVLHADETGWRTDGQSGYAWLFCTEKTSIFQFEQTRASSVPKKLFGPEKLSGVLVVDRYAGYNKILIRIQYCYAHLLRDVQDLEKGFDNNLEIKAFADALCPLLANAMNLHGTACTDEEYYQTSNVIKDRIIEVVESDAKHFGIRKIQEIFRKSKDRLYHWVTDRRVPAHNNLAERNFRSTVIARKISFGSQSLAGAKTRGILMTILHTARKRLLDENIEAWTKNCLDSISRNPNIYVFSLLPK